MFAQPAAAADLPAKARPIAWDAYWSGYYVGVHGGWGWSLNSIDDPSYNPTYSALAGYGNGPLAGGQIGVNWQNGNFVYGLELDGSWASIRGYRVTPQTVIFDSSGSTMDFRALASIAGRAGYAAGPWLFYAKGGGAYANLKLTTLFVAEGNLREVRDRFGVVAGAGVEVAFLRNVSAKLEYNFFYFTPDDLVHYATQETTATIDNSVQVVKAGINVYFGGERGLTR